MIVIDASLAAKLVIHEPDTDTARDWFAALEDEVTAPDLIAIEVAQSIVRRVNARDASAQEGRAALTAWRQILDRRGITLERSAPANVDAAATLGIDLGHPVKDCVYLALAIENGCDLATCDAKFAAKARTMYPAVMLLADYAAS